MTEVAQVLDSLINDHFRLLPGSFFPEQCDERLFPLAIVLVQTLSNGGRVA